MIRKRICTGCRQKLTSDNCCVSVFKRGNGYCRKCFTDLNRRIYWLDPKKAVSRQLSWRKRNPEKYRNISLKSEHGMTKEEYDLKLEAQKGLCDICNCFMIKPHQDHNHATGQNRSLLCRSCNTLLGFAKENIEILASAIRYLQKYADGSSIQTESVGMAQE